MGLNKLSAATLTNHHLPVLIEESANTGEAMVLHGNGASVLSAQTT